MPAVVAVLVVLALVAAGALVLLGRRSVDGRSTGTDVDATETTTRKRKDRTSTNRSADEVVIEALTEIEGFWAGSFPKLFGAAYEPISGGLHPYGPRTSLPPCPGIRSYDDIAENAFYCPEADLIAWDTQNLLVPLRDEFGELTLGIVMAHEMGHAIQSRAGFEARTVTLEQQADCYAGAWVRSVVDGRSSAFEVGPGELDAALGGMLLLRDAPGVDASDPDAHGSAFDRVAALKDGFVNGAASCAGYDDELIAQRLVALPFLDAEDEASGGNLPFEDIEDLAVADLEDYWSKVFTQSALSWTPVSDAVPFDPDRSVLACGGKRASSDDYVGAAYYCKADDYVAWDAVNLAAALYEQGGDFAVATVIGAQYSAAVQARLDLTGKPLGLSLQADCLTGTWAASMFLEDRGSSQVMLLSPGDLDEAIMALLAMGEAPKAVALGTAERGSGFQRVGAFQDGFVNGLSSCDAYLQR